MSKLQKSQLWTQPQEIWWQAVFQISFFGDPGMIFAAGLTAVPEPSSAFLPGLACAFGVFRRGSLKNRLHYAMIRNLPGILQTEFHFDTDASP